MARLMLHFGSNWHLFFAFGVTLLLDVISLDSPLVIVTHGQEQEQSEEPEGLQPNLIDTNLRFELVSSLPSFPTNMAFVGANDILVLSKNDGQVLRIKDGNLLGAALKVNVTGKDEMGLLGIASEAYRPNDNGKYVFLYYSKCISEAECNNFVYRYEWAAIEGKLVKPSLLLKLPALPGPSHMGGDIAIGPDGYIYLTVGDLLPSELFNKERQYNTKAQNYLDGVQPDGRAGILRATQDGKPIGSGILGNAYPLNMYFAYGIKNSFGIGFDPVSGKLWNTDNGPDFGDEVNLVEPGFNGGWSKVQGFWSVSETGEKMERIAVQPNGLVDFGGKGKYHEPKLVWDKNVAPTALIFLNSTKLGSQYLNDIFIGSVEEGRIFHFDLGENRTNISLPNSIEDRIVTEDNEQQVLFATGFGIVTDLQVGPHDGFLYVVAADRPSKTGAVYRIVPK